MAASYRASYTGIGELLCAPFMVAEMRRRAERVKALAEATAPVDDDPHNKHRGRYKRSFSVESGIRVGKTRRAYGRVLNDAPEAYYVEYGNVNTPRHRILGRALEAAGGED